MAAVRVLISGRVQGVGYRAWCSGRAQALGLDGWVRNRTDGTVEAVFSGTDAAVEAMIAACVDGPPHAAVRDIAREAWTAAVAEGFAARETV